MPSPDFDPDAFLAAVDTPGDFLAAIDQMKTVDPWDGPPPGDVDGW